MVHDLPARRTPAYRHLVLQEPRLTAAGVEHGAEERRELLAWREVAAGVAAEVGEPEGVRTMVFDLIAETREGRVALRLDAEPGEAATGIARALAAALGDRAQASIKRLAADGIPARWFPDLASFEEASCEELR